MSDYHEIHSGCKKHYQQQDNKIKKFIFYFWGSSTFRPQNFRQKVSFLATSLATTLFLHRESDKKW